VALRAALACLSLYPMASTIEMLERRASLSDSAVCVRVYVCICVCGGEDCIRGGGIKGVST
jgi:hypothetical protein